MLSTDEFAEWSKKVVLFLHNTSRVEDEPWPNLLFEKGGVGFPTMSYLDANGALLKQVGNITPVAELEAAFQELQRWQALRAEVATGGAGTEKELALFRLELAMGNRPYAEMIDRREALRPHLGDDPGIDQKLVDLQFTEILRQTPRTEQHAGGARLLPMFRAGRIPATGTDTAFWQYLFAHAAHERDVALFKELLAYVKEHKAGDPRLARYIGTLEEQLRKLEGK